MKAAVESCPECGAERGSEQFEKVCGRKEDLARFYRRASDVIERGEHSPVVMDALVFAGVYKLGRAVVARVPRSDAVCLFLDGRLVHTYDADSAIAVAFRRRRRKDGS